jgi:hypothetical protein
VIVKHRWRLPGREDWVLLLDCGHAVASKEEVVRADCDMCGTPEKRRRVPDGMAPIRVFWTQPEGTNIVGCRACSRWWVTSTLIDLRETFGGDAALVCWCGVRCELGDLEF